MKTARTGSSAPSTSRLVSNDATWRPNAFRRTVTSTSPRWLRSSTIIPAQVPNTGRSNARTASSSPYRRIRRPNAVDSPPGRISPSRPSSCSGLRTSTTSAPSRRNIAACSRKFPCTARTPIRSGSMHESYPGGPKRGPGARTAGRSRGARPDLRGDVPAVAAAGAAGVDEALEVRERLREGEPALRRRQPALEGGGRDGGRRPWLSAERRRRSIEQEPVVLGDLSRASHRILDHAVVARQRYPRGELADPPQRLEVIPE